MPNYICPECKKQGLQSTVTIGFGRSTMLGYSSFADENGNIHKHDPNNTSFNCVCSRGHKFEACKKNPCPTCGLDWWKNQILSLENKTQEEKESILAEYGILLEETKAKRLYSIEELEKLKEECEKTFDTLANSFISKGQKFPSDFPSLEFFIDFLKIKELKSNETSRI